MTVLSDYGVEDLATLYAGQEYEENELPSVVCQATDVVEDPPNGGNYLVRCAVLVYSKADRKPPEVEQLQDDPREEHHTLVGTVRDALRQEDLVSQLSAAVDDYTVDENGVNNVGGGTSFDGRALVTTTELEIFCAPKDLA